MKREKYKSNKALALFLCGAVLLFSIGLALARGSGGSEPYKTTDLVLTQGDSGYDLTTGISFDTGKYTLAVSDQGGFDINTPGTYVVGYTLTPITGSAVTALPSKPVDSTSNGGQPQEKPPAANTEGTAPVKSDANPSGTDTAAPQTGKPDAAKPDTTNPDATKLDTSNPDAIKPATTKPETTKPDEIKPETTNPDATKPATTKPETTKPDATKPEAAKPETIKPETTKPDAIKPDTPKPETAKPDEIKPETAKPDATKPATTQNAPSKPVATQDSVKPSTSAKAVVVSSLGVSTQQGSLFLSQNLLTGASGCGVTEVAPDPLLLADASKSNASKQKDTKAEALKAEPSKGNESATTESTKPSAGDQSGVTESAKPSAADQSGTTESSKPSAGDQSAATESTKPLDKQPVPTESVKPSTGDQPAPTESTKPSIGDQPSTTKPTAPTAPESQSQTGMQGAGGSATQPEAQPEKLEPITFTRHVVVTPAVEYQDLRLDVSSAASTDEINAALLSEMKFDDKKYAVKVTDDGNFIADRIGEYQVSYKLSDAEDGHVISELQRYVWVTAPGVTFEAQPLTVDTSKDYDLLADITYNSKKYDLSLVNPNAFDVTLECPQRVMYRLTLRADSQKANQADLTDQTGQTNPAGSADQADLTDQTDPSGATAQAGSENASPAGVTEPSVTNHEQTGQLEVAVFGREVTVNSGHFIHVDAPPLIVTQGAVQTVNLLEGITAVDENGNSVPLVVLDRSDLDKSIKEAEAADPSAVKNPQQSEESGESTAPSAINNQTQIPPTLMLRSSLPNLGSAPDASLKKDDGQGASSATGTENGSSNGVSAGAAGTANGTTKPSSNGAANGTATASAVDPQDETTASDSAENPLIIDLSEDDQSENVTLPANLPPEIYKILMAYVDPKTGRSTKFTREMVVNRSSNPVSLSVRIGSGANSKIGEYFSLSSAFDTINGSPKGTEANPRTYTVAITDFSGGQYYFSIGDQRSLSKLGGMGPYTTVVLSGNSGGYYAYKLKLSGRSNEMSTMEFPVSADYTKSTHFAFQDIQLLSENNFYLVANGSQLTMDVGVDLRPSTGKSFTVVGGGKDSSAPKTEINTNVIINDGRLGTYAYVCGGNWGADTNGKTKVTIDQPPGCHTVVTCLYAGGGGISEDKGYHNQTGNTDLEIRGGTIGNFAYGGTHGVMRGISNTMVSGGNVASVLGGSVNGQVGQSNLTITGGAVVGKAVGGCTQATGISLDEPCTTAVLMGGGTVNQLQGSGYQPQYGDSTVTLTGGTVTGQFKCGSDPGGHGTAKGYINGGKVTGDLIGGNTNNIQKYTTFNLYVNTNLTVSKIAQFDGLTLGDNVTLSATGGVQSYNGGVIGFSGTINFGTNSVLSMLGFYDTNKGNVAGNLVTTGQGAKLELPRQSDHSKASLSLSTGSVGVSAAKPLELAFNGDTSQVTSGDVLLKFTGNKNAASDISGYTTAKNSFPRALFLQGDKNTGNVSVGHGVSLQDVSDPQNPGPVVFYGTVEAAMNAIGTGADYKLTIRKENYALTLNDGIAIATKGGSAGHITFTGGFHITDTDPLGPGDTVGKGVRRTVVIGSDPSLQGAGLHPDISFTTNSTVENMKLKYLLPGGSIYANGHKLLVGANVEINSDSSYYPALYGGKKDAPVASTNMELNSGKYSAIYGGGDEATATVTGDTNIAIGGNGELIGPMYGGGRLGNVGGNVNLDIKGGKLAGGDPQNPGIVKNWVIGGGQSGNVTGSVSVIINGGTATGAVEVAGCDSGTVGKDVSIDITKGEAEQAIHLPMAHVYGGGLNGGQVMGSATIKLHGGADYGTVSGGGKPKVDPQTGDVLAPDSSVHGAKNITILGDSVETNNIVNFTNLNLGMAGTAKTTLMIKSSMDSNWGGAADLSDRTGNLNFYEGSVLNLTGSAKSSTGAKNSLAVGNIFTNKETNPTHLHVHKDAAGTYPLHVAGENTSAEKNRIVLGSVGEGQESASGDTLLIFQNDTNAIQKQYLSDSSNLDIIKQKAVIQYGILDFPKAYLDRVVSTEPDTKDNVGTGVDKTLFFTFTSVTDGTAQSPVVSAYVDTRASANSIWAQSGVQSDIPDTGTEVKLKRNPADLPGAPPTWTGNVKINIKEPQDPATNDSFYFVHVITKGGTYQSFALDVHSPDNLGTTEVNRVGNNNYKLTVKFQDVKKDISAALTNIPWAQGEKKETYTASGLYETAWCVGTIGSPPSADAVAAALQTPMNQDVSDLHDPTLADLNDPFATTELSFSVPETALGSTPEEVKKKVVYLFVKDKNGNTRQVTVPMSESMIDVTIPLRTGVIALKGGDESEVAAPVCYVTNHSRLPVTAEIIKSDLTPSGIQFVGQLDETKLNGNEVNLEIVQVPGSGDGTNAFLTRPVVKINPADPLYLGVMAAGTSSSPPMLAPTNPDPSGGSGTDSGGSGSTPDPGGADPGATATKSYVYFTFDALFNPSQIDLTRNWSVCGLTYKFTMHPGASAVKAGASNGALSNANGVSPGASSKARTSTSVSSNDPTRSSDSGSLGTAKGK